MTDHAAFWTVQARQWNWTVVELMNPGLTARLVRGLQSGGLSLT